MKHSNLRNFLVALFATSTVATGCNKEDDNGGNGGSGTDNLTAIEKKIVGKWQRSTETFVTYGSPSNDTQNTLLPCEADDVFTFTDDKNYTVSDGATACANPGATYTSTWTWYVTPDSSFIITHGPGRYKPKIYFLDNSTLKISSNDVNSTAYATFTRR